MYLSGTQNITLFAQVIFPEPSIMPNINLAIAERMSKGDIIWVPYRKDPMWPALVNNVYPQKVSYLFFPLSPGDRDLKKSRFSCAPKLVYAFVPSEPLSEDANEELRKAYTAAREYCQLNGKIRGSAIRSYGEAGVGEKIKNRLNKNKASKKERIEKRKRNKTEANSVKSEDEEESESLPLKKATPSSLEPSGPSGSQRQSQITQEESLEMMRVINDRLDSLVDDVWHTTEVTECQKQTMNTKMTIKLKNNQFLKESDYANVFERLVNLVRHKNSSLTLISAFNITASHIIPHVLINCYSICKNVEYQVAKDIYHYQSTRVLGLDPSMNIPVTDHLEELCRLACDESDAIRK